MSTWERDAVQGLNGGVVLAEEIGRRRGEEGGEVGRVELVLRERIERNDDQLRFSMKAIKGYALTHNAEWDNRERNQRAKSASERKEDASRNRELEKLTFPVEVRDLQSVLGVPITRKLPIIFMSPFFSTRALQRTD